MSTPAYELAGCPACDDRRQRELTDAATVRRELEELWLFHTRRLRAGTPPERLQDRLSFSQRPPLRLVQCARCGTVFRNPRERDVTLRALYANADADPDALRALVRTQHRAFHAQARRLTRYLGRTGSGLEVGSYAGGFLLAASARGWRFEGVDVNEPAVRFSRTLGATAAVGEITDVDAGRRFDAIAFWNCFDQLADPAAALRAAAARLSPGGVVVVRVPNGAFYAAARRWLSTPAAPAARALLAHNNLMAFPYRHGFTVRALRLLMQRCGLRVDRVRGGPLVPLSDEWTRAWATLEERAVKGLVSAVASMSERMAAHAPWIEVYARALPHHTGRLSRDATVASREANGPACSDDAGARRRTAGGVRRPLRRKPDLDRAGETHPGHVPRLGAP